MKDENGIEIKCENCDVNAQRDCSLWNAERGKVGSNGCREYFYPSYKAYEARIAELQRELHVIQDSERAEAQEADRLREEVKELKKENERLSKKIIDLGTGTLAEKNYQLAIKQIQNPSKSFYQRYSGVSEEYAIGALEQCATEADELQARVKDLESKLTETIKLLSERSRECGKLEAEVRVLKAFVLKVHTSPVIFEDVNRALRDDAKTLWEKLNQSAESEVKDGTH